MADVLQVITVSTAVVSGKGVLTGLIVSLGTTSSSGTIIIYDSTSASGTVIFQAEVFSSNRPTVILFEDRFAPRFTTGLYVALDANMIANIFATER